MLKTRLTASYLQGPGHALDAMKELATVWIVGEKSIRRGTIEIICV